MPHMEITLETIQEARTLGVTKEYAPYLKRFKSWDTLPVDDLVLGKVKKNTQTLWSQTNLLKARLALPADRNRRYALRSLAEIINFQKTALAKAIHTTSVNHLLIFLETHRYFEIPHKDYLADIPFNPDQLSNLANAILPFFGRYGFELKIEAHARHHEQTALEDYNQGFIDSDIHKVYTLIRAVQDARGIRLPFRLRSLLGFLFVIDFNAFCQYIDTLKTPTQFVAALEWMSDEQLSIFFKDHTIDNKWLLFEGVRQLVTRTSDDDGLHTAKNLLTKLYGKDEHFFQQACEHEKRSLAFNQVLGGCLAAIPAITPDLINQLFKIDKYTFFIKHKDLLLESFAKDAHDDRIKILLSTIHEKWLTYLDLAPKDKDFNVLHPVLTDYANYIVKYLCRFCTVDETKKLWDETYLAVENIDSKWHISQSSRATYFMLVFGKLYLYTLSLIDSDHNDTMTDKFQKLLSNSIFMKRYANEHTTDRLVSVNQVFNHIKDLLKIEAEASQ